MTANNGRTTARIKYAASTACGIVLIAALVGVGGGDRLALLLNIRVLPFLGAAVCTFLLIVLMALRWKIAIAGMTGAPAPRLTLLARYVLSGRVLGLVIPKDLSDIGLRTFYLKAEHDHRLIDAASSVFADRIADIFVCLVFAVPAVMFWSGLIHDVYFSLGCMVAFGVAGGALFVCAGNAAFGIPARLLDFFRMLFGKSARYAGAEYVFSRSSLMNIYLLTLCKFVFSAARVVLVAAAFCLSISPVYLVVGLPVAQLSYLVAFTPGGLGIHEMGWYLVLRLASVSPADTVAFAVGLRVFSTLVIAVLWGAPHVFTLVSRNDEDQNIETTTPGPRAEE